MHMLTKRDLEQISEVLDQKLEEKLEQKLTQELVIPFNEFATQVEQRFVGIEMRMSARMDSIEARMVTKEYLDDKISEARSGIMRVIYEVDRKFLSLADILGKNGTISGQEHRSVRAMPPFPQSA